MTSKHTPKHANITAQKFVLANTRDWQYRALKVVDPDECAQWANCRDIGTCTISTEECITYERMVGHHICGFHVHCMDIQMVLASMMVHQRILYGSLPNS